MRLIVLFDLPVVTKTELRSYTLFHRFLINDGYDMIQFSIYGRILNGNDGGEKHMKRLLNSLPLKGSVRCLTITEKQYASMKPGRLTTFSRKSAEGKSNVAVLRAIFKTERQPEVELVGVCVRTIVVYPG